MPRTTKKTHTTLKDAVDKKRREISSDNISMSIGEILNLYKEEELDIHPEFQRVFRWFPEQKSRLIESMLLGIPLPPIYVATNEAGVWEVIDGVQRLSTIFEFMGELSGPSADSDELVKREELVLESTKHLPELAGVRYSKMDTALKLEFKRTRLDVKVLARESEGSSGKFDLFERLNTYGQPLSPQELRNCILVSLNADMFRWLKELASDEAFRYCTLLSEAQLLERYDMDLVLRFLTCRDASAGEIGDVHEFLRDKMEEIASSRVFDFEAEANTFKEVFAYLNEKLSGDSFRAWNAVREEFRGGFTLAGFEGIGFAIGKHWSAVRLAGDRFNVVEYVKAVWQEPEYTKSFSGLRARERMARVIPAAERVISLMLPTKRRVANKRAQPVKKAGVKRIGVGKTSAK